MPIDPSVYPVPDPLGNVISESPVFDERDWINLSLNEFIDQISLSVNAQSSWVPPSLPVSTPGQTSPTVSPVLARGYIVEPVFVTDLADLYIGPYTQSIHVDAESRDVWLTSIRRFQGLMKGTLNVQAHSSEIDGFLEVSGIRVRPRSRPMLLIDIDTWVAYNIPIQYTSIIVHTYLVNIHTGRNYNCVFHVKRTSNRRDV